MVEEQLNFTDYQLHTYNRWQKTILRTSLLAALLTLGAEILIYFTLRQDVNRTDVNGFYVLIRIIIPTVINSGALLLGKIIYSSNVKVELKNFFASFSFFVVTSVLAVFHNFFPLLLICPAFSLVQASIFGDRKILQITGLLSIVTMIAAAITYWLDPETGDVFYKILTLGTNATLTVCCYIFANSVLKSQIEKIEHIHATYKRQTAIIEELKIDPLTQLSNRTAMQSAIEGVLSRASDKGLSYLAILDLDFFKNVNDTYGHVAGDKVLITLSEIIKNTISYRNAFRFGGEEFVLLFEDATREQVNYAIALIRRDFSVTRFDFAKDKSFTLSAGVAINKKDDTSASWISRADKALYHVKTTGRNNVKFTES